MLAGIGVQAADTAAQMMSEGFGHGLMALVPEPVYLVVHAALALVAIWLWRRAGRPAFLLFFVAEVLYLTYHLHVLDFHFAHTIAEVCDAVAFIWLGMGAGSKA
ncbi:MAG TPA: hypothetical protein VFK78_09010 [Gemmatimonadales bacterium]|nr:hypothetical protein [Gemmatimonadales bacterium]